MVEPNAGRQDGVIVPEARVDADRLQLAFDRVRALIQDLQQQQLPSAVLAAGNRDGLVHCEAFQRPGG
jgi:hypothetical protein